MDVAGWGAQIVVVGGPLERTGILEDLEAGGTLMITDAKAEVVEEETLMVGERNLMAQDTGTSKEGVVILTLEGEDAENSMVVVGDLVVGARIHAKTVLPMLKMRVTFHLWDQALFETEMVTVAGRASIPAIF